MSGHIEVVRGDCHNTMARFFHRFETGGISDWYYSGLNRSTILPPNGPPAYFAGMNEGREEGAIDCWPPLRVAFEKH